MYINVIIRKFDILCISGIRGTSRKVRSDIFQKCGVSTTRKNINI